jgi:alpha-mannosidase
MTSLVHDGREVLAGPANVFELSDDRPVAYDAWEVEPYADDTRRPLPGAHAHRVHAGSPERAELAFEHRVGERSTLTQIVRLDAGARRLEFRARIDWRERHALLQVAFPLAVRSPRATYEMQFGVAERPTHANTQADAAQFEVPAHRFGDLSEHGFGAALLTPDTHGMSCHGGTMRITLLRAPTDPDPEADQGEHELRYAIHPHRGGWQEAGVVAQARAFAEPLLWAAGGGGAFASVDDPALVLDSIKRAEDSDALILRLYEAHGGRGTARLRLGVPCSRAWETDLLEDELEELPVRDGAVELAYRPWQILTVAVRS